nr:MAG TPA: hypothetical protein [Caudoviricetes sp.]DAY28295.1 MAG TPA: hypothetical protein [Caudoviricetes sp.]
MSHTASVLKFGGIIRTSAVKITLFRGYQE